MFPNLNKLFGGMSLPRFSDFLSPLTTPEDLFEQMVSSMGITIPQGPMKTAISIISSIESPPSQPSQPQFIFAPPKVERSPAPATVPAPVPVKKEIKGL